jgi:ABC-type xylose transport system permease subunit
VLVLLARQLVIHGVTNSLVKNDANKPAAQHVLTIGTSMLNEIGGATVVVGIPFVLAGWFAGPAKWATAGRRTIAPFMRDHAAWTFGIVAIVMTVIFIWQPIPATGDPVGIVVFLVLAFLGTEVLRRQVEREFPAVGQRAG